MFVKFDANQLDLYLEFMQLPFDIFPFLKLELTVCMHTIINFHHFNEMNILYKTYTSFQYSQGVSQKKTGDTPFRKNDAFSKPISEYWNEPGPHELEDYPKM